MPPRSRPLGARRRERAREALAANGDASAASSRFGSRAPGLAACDVGRATEWPSRSTGDGSSSPAGAYPLDPGARVIVVGSGKATLAIAGALERIARRPPRRGSQSSSATPRTAIALERIEVLLADHPLPSERDRAARARRLLELAAGAGAATS